MKFEVLKVGDYKATFLRTNDKIILFSFGKPIVAIDTISKEYFRLCSKSDLTNTTAKHLKLFFEMFGFQYNRNNFLDTRETKVVKINLILGK